MQENLPLAIQLIICSVRDCAKILAYRFADTYSNLANYGHL